MTFSILDASTTLSTGFGFSIKGQNTRRRFLIADLVENDQRQLQLYA
jgi:hypothetical protein